jgi:5-methylcytosine-specific restriction endonuclease McrBC GTP-binding regulatory subunit McrB
MQTAESCFLDPEDDLFYVPENVYIIGTMNDIDRSVESFDFALRRRFAWINIKADDQVGMWNGQIDKWKDTAASKMSALNNAITTIDGLNEAYHIGPAYFLKLNETEGNFDLLWQYHIANVVREYFRGMPDVDENLEILKKEYDLA